MLAWVTTLSSMKSMKPKKLTRTPSHNMTGTSMPSLSLASISTYFLLKAHRKCQHSTYPSNRLPLHFFQLSTTERKFKTVRKVAEEKRTSLKNTAQPLFCHCFTIIFTIVFPISKRVMFVTNFVMIVTFLL